MEIIENKGEKEEEEEENDKRPYVRFSCTGKNERQRRGRKNVIEKEDQKNTEKERGGQIDRQRQRDGERERD